MKKLRNILFFLLLLIAGTGCKKFLDKELEDQTASGSINYANINGMYAPVSGLYRAAGGENPGFTHWMDAGIRTVRGDDVAKGSSVNDQSTLTDIRNFKNDNPDVVSFWGANNYWVDHFSLVVAANEAMKDLDKYAVNIPAGDAANQAKYRQYKGEVRVLRAIGELLGSRIFGDVPIISDNSTLATVSKSTALDVRKWIMSEMDSCINDLEDARPNQSVHQGAITKYTALLLKAKAGADAAGSDNGSTYWNDVITATDQIINSNKFNLYPDFYQLWKIPGKLSDESLYELQFTDFGTSTGTSVTPGAFFPFQGPNGDQKGSPVSGWGFLEPTQGIVDFLNGRNDSVRLKTSVLFAGATEATFVTTQAGDKIYGNSNGQTRFMGKAYTPASQMTPGRTDYSSNNNLRVFRYADVLLLNAEAKIRKGQSGDAEINLVRARAKLAPIAGATLQTVIDERRAEFACEWWGERYNDLIRTGQAITVLAPQGFAVGKEGLRVPPAQKDLNPNF